MLFVGLFVCEQVHTLAEGEPNLNPALRIGRGSFWWEVRNLEEVVSLRISREILFIF
jgi:hypothetical protein